MAQPHPAPVRLCRHGLLPPPPSRYTLGTVSGKRSPWFAFFRRPDVPESEYRTTLLHILTNLFLVAMLSTSLAQIPGGSFPTHQLVAVTIGASTCMFVRWAMHAGRVRLGSIVFLTFFWLASGSMLFPEGWASPSADAFYPIIIAAAALLGGWGAVVFSLATLVAVLAAGLAEHMLWTDPIPFSSPAGLAIGWSTVLISSGFLLFVLMRELERNVQRAEGSARQYQDMVNGSPDAILVLDREGKMRSSNPALERITGYSADELIGLRLSEMPFLDEQGRRRAEARFDDAKSGTSDIAETYDITRKNGRSAAIELNRRYVTTADGGMRMDVVARDVTMRRRAENKEQELQQQLQHAQRIESIGRLAGGVAHEFNNYLTAIMGNLESIRRSEPAEADTHADLDAAMQAAKRAAEVTAQLLAFGHAGEEDRSVLSVTDELGVVEVMLRRLIDESIDLIVEVDAERDTVLANTTEINQIVVNLAVNACDAMPSGGELRIRAHNRTLGKNEALRHNVSPGQYVQIEVRDTGVGIDEETQTRLFEPFFTTKSVGEGTGLGLSVVHGLVGRLGGSIRVESVVGEGTSFQVLLPTVDAPRPRGARSARKASPPQRGSVLVVDDDEMVGKAICRLLSLEGFEVLRATSGDQAVDLLRSSGDSVDALITDVRLRREHGPQVAGKVRTLLPEVAVLYISGYSANSLPKSELEHASFLAKPFEAEELVAALESLLADTASKGR